MIRYFSIIVVNEMLFRVYLNAIAKIDTRIVIIKLLFQ